MSDDSTMSDDKRLIFHIDAYSPETIPMAKLAGYMADFAELLGKEHAVHFERLDPGSTVIVSRVEFEDVPKVRTRLTEIRNGTAPKELVRLVAEIDKRLANDNARGLVLFADHDDDHDPDRVPGHPEPEPAPAAPPAEPEAPPAA